MDDEREELEHIPWPTLEAEAEAGTRRMWMLAAGAVGAMIVGFIAARALDGTSPEPVAPGASVISLDETAVASLDPTVETTSSSTPLFSEADLMALPPESASRAAATRAEWFVTDYFTADLEPSGSADVRAALPGGAELPASPQEGAVGISYVEWARAFRVERVSPEVFSVGVAYRALGAPPERGFTRLPVRAVEIMVQVSVDGGSVVTELPRPIPLPAGPEPAPWPAASEEAPQPVVDGAIASTSAWGAEARLLEAQPIPGGWRVLLTMSDEVGNRWPVAVRVDEEGRPLIG